MEQEITLENIHKRMMSVEEIMKLILELLTKEDKKKQTMEAEAEDVSRIPPIPNAMAAKLLRISTRQLQRKRRDWKLTWEERGRNVSYHLIPIIKAIHRLQLKWNEAVLEEIKKSNRKLPKVK